MSIRGKIFLVAILLILLLMLVPYLPWFKPTESRQADIESSPPDELREEIDSDGDLLVDEDELYLTGTNPSEPDTDLDGIVDGEEYKYWTERYKDIKDKDIPDWLKKKYPYMTNNERKGLYLSTGDIDGDGKSNINDKDSDNDGLPDGFEIAYELDPADPTSNITDLPADKQRYILIHGLGESELTDFDDNLNMNDFYAEFLDDKEFDDIIFWVSPASYPRYWRGAVYDKYASGIWDSVNTDAYLSYDGEELELDKENKKVKYQGTYTITLKGMARGVIPTALHTTQVFSIKPDTTVEYSNARTFEVNNYVKSYSFNATIFEYDNNKLLNANAPAEITNYYLTSTDSIHDYIFELGTELTSKDQSDYEKASIIAQYLMSNYIYDINSYDYNLKFPNNDYKIRYLPIYDKILINMLFKTHRGRCVDFATAFVLMCRANDIPAQLVTGFAPGSIDEQNQNLRVVRLGHKHAWAEVLLDGIGWVPFEVTPKTAIHGNTTGVTVAGADPTVISFPDGQNGSFDDYESGSGGGTTNNEYIDILNLINNSKLDSDHDGIKNDKDFDDDNDGLSDLEELKFGTNPFSKDTDRDSLSDYEEIMDYGTSPINSDTDSDGLTDYNEIITTKTDPLKYDTDGGGAHDGLEVEFDGDPNDPNDDKQFIDSDKDGLTDAKEEELGTNPNNPDTDGGGASDKLEHIAGLDPVNDPKDDLKALDSDKDGLTDAKEEELGTDRFIYDSDSGGISDGIEYLKKYDPLNTSDDFWLKDSDYDGLINADEEKYGTDIFDEDTDYGGVIDGVEVKYGSDPLDPKDDKKLDSDKDGLTNVKEKEIGTKEFDSDTDGDNLPDGWVDYNKNGRKDLGEFEDRDLDGIRDTGPWNNGTGPGETNPKSSDTDNDGLNDGLEITIGTDPLDYDSDDDGLSDLEEIRLLTDPFNNDTDYDGLTDGAEVRIHGSNPTIIDSDGDGVDDWLEIKYGTDPYNVDSDFDGLLDFYDIDWSSNPNIDIDFDPNINIAPDNPINPKPPVIPVDPIDPGYQPDIPDPGATPNPPNGGSNSGFGGGIAGGNLGNVWPIIIGIILIIIIGLYYINWRSQHIEELAEIAERAEEKLSKIEDEREFDSIRLAIFEAYKSMLKVMQRYDFVRNPAMTPSEFRDIIAAELPISDKNINALTAIFEEARYSNHKLNNKIRDDAIASFRNLKLELRGISHWSKREFVPVSAET